MTKTLFLSLLLVATATALPQQQQPQPTQALRFPSEFDLELEDTASLIADVMSSGIGQIVRFGPDVTDLASNEEVPMKSGQDSPYLPVVQMHGMGDFAENPMGMLPLRKAVSKELNGTYVKNVALGNNIITDMLGSFIKMMGEEVDVFAKSVQTDSNLANGFNAIGYSQGSLIIRGYIEKYNNPPVKNFISVHGPMMGVAGFPKCNMTASICRMFDNFLGDAAYNTLSQHVLAQSNYYRDPKRIPQYLAHNIWLPFQNNEASPNVTFKQNLASLDRLVCVHALGDTVVWPSISEWWGFFEDGSEDVLLEMKDTEMYQSDLIGLKTLVESNRYVNLTTQGDHLQFDESFLLGLVDLYLK